MAPDYLYGLGFGFTASSAWGTVGLISGPRGKTAVATVTAPGSPAETASVPFEWPANRLYFVFVHQLGGGSWGAWVYDHTAGTWTAFGALSLSWGKLAASTVTPVGWVGSPSTSCAAYRRADVFVHAPTGCVGGATSDACLSLNTVVEGTCVADTTAGPTGWVRYRTGAD